MAQRTARWLVTLKLTCSATRKVGACITADGKLVVMALSLGTSEGHDDHRPGP